jgi:hypothetical protein
LNAHIQGKDIQTVLEKAGQPKFMTAWHGSVHDFDKFSVDKIGTGEGDQAYGWGLYFAGRKEVAEYYRDALSDTKYYSNGRELKGNEAWAAQFLHEVTEYNLQGRRVPLADAVNKIEETLADGKARNEIIAFAKRLDKDGVDIKSGNLYQVNLAPKEDEYLLWDKPLSEQSNKVKTKLTEIDTDSLDGYDTFEHSSISGLKGEHPRGGDGGVGSDLYFDLAELLGSDKAASEYLRSLGIRGIKYLDGDSRGKGEGDYNYVIFDDADIEIEAKFSRAPDFRAIKTTELPDTLNEAITQTSLAKLKGKEGTPERQKYDNAKGNEFMQQGASEEQRTEDALDTVLPLVKDAKVKEIQDMLDPDKPIYVLPVQQRESVGENKIPTTYANILSGKISGQLLDGIYKQKGKHNTGASQIARLEDKKVFVGEVPTDGQIVIVDDNYTSGGTIIALMEHIKAQGGNVVALTTLSASRYGKGVKAKPEYIQSLINDIDLPVPEIEAIIGHSLEGLTNAEINLIRNSTRKGGERGLRKLFPSSVLEGRDQKDARSNETQRAKTLKNLDTPNQVKEPQEPYGAKFSRPTPQSEIDTIREQYEGTDEWMKAPNGNDTNLNERQWLQVRTPSFKNWFGDWQNDPDNASKVVDENGEPLVVYHGTDEEFYTFRKKYHGIYFSDNPTLTNGFGGTTKEVFLSMRYPVYHDFAGANIYGTDPYDHRNKSEKNLGQLVSEAKKTEKDGVIAEEILPLMDNSGLRSGAKPVSDWYVVFNPNQIKSATANTGTFDPNNDDIRYSRNIDNQKQDRKDSPQVEKQITEQDKKDVAILNQVIADYQHKHGKNEAERNNVENWRNAYQASGLPDPLSGIGDTFTGLFGKRVVGFRPTDERYNFFRGEHLAENPEINGSE